MIFEKFQQPQRWVEALKGCVLGGAIGDAFGFAYENRTPPFEVDVEKHEWRISDDTQLTLATLESMVQKGKVDPEDVANTFKKWFGNRRFTGLGASTLKALIELQAGNHWALVGRKGEMAAGNGAAIRIAPAAFFLDPENLNDRMVVRDVCRITHHSEEAYCGALAVCLAITYLQTHTAASQEEMFSYITNALPDSNTRDSLLEMKKCLNESIRFVGENFGNSGYVAQSVPFAIFGASRIFSLDFVQILSEIIAAGGDTDSNASIAGQIMGSFLKVQNLPRRMVEKLSLPEDIFIQELFPG